MVDIVAKQASARNITADTFVDPRIHPARLPDPTPFKSRVACAGIVLFRAGTFPARNNIFPSEKTSSAVLESTYSRYPLPVLCK